MLFLLVSGPRALAPVLKLYAALPLIGEGRWRSLIVAGAILLITVPLMPWGQYLGHWDDVQTALRQEGFGIADASPSIVSVFTVRVPGDPRPAACRLPCRALTLAERPLPLRDGRDPGPRVGPDRRGRGEHGWCADRHPRRDHRDCRARLAGDPSTGRTQCERLAGMARRSMARA